MILRAELALGYSWSTWHYGIDTGEEGSAKMQWVETHVPWLSCLKHKVQVRASSHVAEMGI